MEDPQSVDSLDALKVNILHEKSMVREIEVFLRYFDTMNDLERVGYKINLREKKILIAVINSLVTQLKMINMSTPGILKRVSFFGELPIERGKVIGKEEESKAEAVEKKGEKLVTFMYRGPSEEKGTLVTIRKEDKLRFLRELSLTSSSMKRLKKDYASLKGKIEKFKKPSKYAKISNRLFLKFSTSLIDKGKFAGLRRELRKSNLPFLVHTYLSMAFFTSLLSIFAAVLFIIFLLFFKLTLEFPFLMLAGESMLLRFAKTFWLIFAFPILTFFAFYFYPTTERKSLASKINQELPFVVIHMSAIAGSGVEPTKIFRIIVASEDYPNTKKEMKKLMNQINIYGYDLVSALRESARLSSSSKLAELLNGLATTITSGGELTDFLEKRAETLVFDYKMERERYNKMAETFMDIYISVVIAAPMIMTLLFVMMSITGMGIGGLSIDMLSMLMIFAIAVINIVFLIFLHLKQPQT